MHLAPVNSSPDSTTSPLSPDSPKSPLTPKVGAFDVYPNGKESETVSDVLTNMGYKNISKLTDTLQGSIWRASTFDVESNQATQVVIKTTDRFLHDHSISTINGSTGHSQENILIEQSILKYLTQSKSCPKSIVHYRRFFETDNDYFLEMENGGHSLFTFVQKAHRLIKNGRISAAHWKKVTKLIYKQMVECIDYIHSKKVCHFDISLENFLINDVQVIVKSKNSRRKKEQLSFILEDIQIKLCDFGLAELFTKATCRSSKFVGKECYASPEVMDNKRRFDARKNDIWCLGVCLFMIATGIAPFASAEKSDKSFMYIMEYGQLYDCLAVWKVLPFVNAALFDLFDNLFAYEDHRISMKQIKRHAYIQNNMDETAKYNK